MSDADSDVGYCSEPEADIITAWAAALPATPVAVPVAVAAPATPIAAAEVDADVGYKSEHEDQPIAVIDSVVVPRPVVETISIQKAVSFCYGGIASFPPAERDIAKFGLNLALSPDVPDEFQPSVNGELYQDIFESRLGAENVHRCESWSHVVRKFEGREGGCDVKNLISSAQARHQEVAELILHASRSYVSALLSRIRSRVVQGKEKALSLTLAGESDEATFTLRLPQHTSIQPLQISDGPGPDVPQPQPRGKKRKAPDSGATNAPAKVVYSELSFSILTKDVESDEFIIRRGDIPVALKHIDKATGETLVSVNDLQYDVPGLSDENLAVFSDVNIQSASRYRRAH